MAIVELDREPRGRRPRGRDGGVIAALLAAASLFALAVWITRPVAAPATQHGADAKSVPAAQHAVSMSLTPADANAGRVMWADLQGAAAFAQTTPSLPMQRTLSLPFGNFVTDVDLAVLPDRLANEAASWTLRDVVVIRGKLGIASVEGMATITWTEGGMAYWLMSPSLSVDELIKLADELR
jgi:hypothetical protein